MNNLLATVIVTLVSLGVGSFVTFLLAKNYYSRASNELNNASNKLYSISRLILEALQHEGRFEIVYNNDKYIVNIHKFVQPSSIPSEEAFGTPTFISHPPKEGQSKSKDIQNDSDITVHFDNKLE